MVDMSKNMNWGGRELLRRMADITRWGGWEVEEVETTVVRYFTFLLFSIKSRQ